MWCGNLCCRFTWCIDVTFGQNRLVHYFSINTCSLGKCSRNALMSWLWNLGLNFFVFALNFCFPKRFFFRAPKISRLTVLLRRVERRISKQTRQCGTHDDIRLPARVRPISPSDRATNGTVRASASCGIRQRSSVDEPMIATRTSRTWLPDLTWDGRMGERSSRDSTCGALGSTSSVGSPEERQQREWNLPRSQLTLKWMLDESGQVGARCSVLLHQPLLLPLTLFCG